MEVRIQPAPGQSAISQDLINLEQPSSLSPRNTDKAASSLSSFCSDSFCACSFFAYARDLIYSLFSPLWNWVSSLFSGQAEEPCDLAMLEIYSLADAVDNNPLYKMGKRWVLNRIKEEHYEPFLGRQTKAAFLIKAGEKVLDCTQANIARNTMGVFRNRALEALAFLTLWEKQPDANDNFSIRVIFFQERSEEQTILFQAFDAQIKDAFSTSYPGGIDLDRPTLNEAREEIATLFGQDPDNARFKEGLFQFFFPTPAPT
jgi:hypothetical protein